MSLKESYFLTRSKVNIGSEKFTFALIEAVVTLMLLVANLANTK